MDRPKFCWDPTPGRSTQARALLVHSNAWNGLEGEHVDGRIVTGIGQVGGCPLLAMQRFFARFPLGKLQRSPVCLVYPKWRC
ncbi:hypothetical protein FA13DRAFT_1746441, partial [Coprinellus micaceus]